MARSTMVERGHERIVILAACIDTVIFGIIVAVALATASLSLFCEALRSGFLVVLELYGLYVLLSFSRGRFNRFEYGTGKLDQMVLAALGTGLLVGGLWMVELMFEVAYGVRNAAPPTGLVIAALVNAISLIVSFVVRRAIRQNPSDTWPLMLVSQVKMRDTMFLGSVGLQLFLTAAALVRDVDIAVLFDILGAAFVTILMCRRGIKVMVQSLPHLLDAPAAEDKQHLIAQVIGSLLPADEVVEIRTRRNGTEIEAEIAVTGAAGRSAAHLCQWTTDIENALKAKGLDVDVAVIVSKIDESQRGGAGTTE